MRQPKYILIAFLILMLATVVCVGQKRSPSRSRTQMGKIQGVVLDASDARIVGAIITIENSQFRRELKSGEEGDFQVALPAGVYQIKAEASGFRRFELSPFKVKAHVSELINIHLDVEPISGRYIK